MAEQSSVSRRGFLGVAGAFMAGNMVRGKGETATAMTAQQSAAVPQSGAHKRKKIPIGVFDPVYEKLSLDEMLGAIDGVELQAVDALASRLLDEEQLSLLALGPIDRRNLPREFVDS